VSENDPPERTRQELAARVRTVLAPYLHRRTFAAGDLLWREGDDAGMLASIESGRVKIHRVLPNGDGVTLFLFGPGDTFGFMPFLDGRPYPAAAQALTDVTALVMPRSQLVDAFQRDPQVALTLVSLLATRLREAFDRIERSSTPEVLPRVAAALASLLPPDPAASSLCVVELPVRSRDLAAAVGVTPESFSRAVTALVKRRVIHRLGARRYQVLDPSALRLAAKGSTGPL
jgi:CRP-like cAMP-binding protein